MKWTKFYQTEQEMLEDMMRTKSDVKTVPYHALVKGYEYIESFKKYVSRNGALTERQMTQLKRLAGEVFKNVRGEKEYWRVSRRCP